MSTPSSILRKNLSPASHRIFLNALGHFAFLLMGILSLVYYKERMLHFDTANYAFNMIYYGDFYTGHGRYISYLPQVIPLLIRNAGGSLQAILMAYSGSFILMFYLLYLLAVYGLKNVQGGLLIVLSTILTMRYKFYAPVGEVMIGIPFVAFLIAYLMSDFYQKKGARVLKLGIAILYSLLFLIIHPYPMISLGLAWGIWMLYSGNWKNIYEYLLPIAWGLMWAIKLQAKGVGTSYENQRYNDFIEGWKVLSNLNDYYVWDRYQWYIDAHYLLPLIICVGACIYLLIQKKWLTVLLSILSFGLLSALALVLFAYMDAPVYLLLDGYLAHLGIIMGLVFVLAWGQKRAYWVQALLVFLVCFSMDRIHGVHKYYEGRETTLMNLMERNGELVETNKLLAHMKDFDWSKLWLSWAVGIETLMMSNLNNPDAPKTLFFEEHSKDPGALLEDQEVFLSLQYFMTPFKVDQFPPQLKLPPGKYKRIDVSGQY